MNAAVEQHCGILSIGHAERLGPGEAAKRDLAWGCLPSSHVRSLPAEGAPVRTGIERWAAVMANPRWAKARAWVGACHIEPVHTKLYCKKRTQKPPLV